MKRYISLLLTLCMVLTLLPVPLFAEEDTSVPVPETSAEEDIVLEEAAPTDPEGSADEPLLPNVEEPVVETLSGTVVATGSCGDDLIWTLDDAGMLTIEGEGDMYDYTSETAPWYAYRDSIKSLVLNGELMLVSDGPFQNLPLLTDIRISASVWNIYPGAFSGCPSLTTFTVDDDNDWYCVVDGVLMTANRHYLVCYPPTKTDSFYAVPHGTEYILNYAFDQASALTSISLPATILGLANFEFDGCPNLSEIQYAGTEALWAIITPNGLNTDADITFGTSDMIGVCGDNATFTFYADTCELSISGYGQVNATTNWPTEHIRTVTIGPDLTGMDGAWSIYPLLESVEVDPANEHLTSIDGVLFECDDDGEVITLRRYPAQKKALSFTVPATVTSINFAAFDRCTYLQELFIPASVDSIADYCFHDETSLTAITVDEDNQNYSSDNGVLLHNGALFHYPAGKTNSSYSIPNGTTTLTHEQFGVCTSLTELRIPLSIVTLNAWVFENLPNLEKIIYEGTEDAWLDLLDVQDLSDMTDAVVTFENNTMLTGSCGDNATYTMDLDSGTLVISGSGAIYDYGYQSMPWYNKGIESIVIESGITYIGNQAFREMTTVKTLSLADTITEIGQYAFEGCEGITTLVLPSQLETINSYAFANCTALQTIYIPASVWSINSYAFRGCTALTAFTVDSGNEEYCALDGVLLSEDQTELLLYPAGNARTSYTVPDGVSRISSYAFSYANNLTSIALPVSLQTISSSAFSDCENLSSVSYAGSEALWAYVSTGKNNEPLLNADFTFGTINTLTGQCGDEATFTLDLDTGELVISGTGEADSSKEWVDYVDLITSITVESGITAVWKDALYDLSNLTALTLSETVTYIDNTVLSTECSKLTTIAVHADNTAFCAVDNVLFNKDMTSLLVYPTGKSGAVYTVPTTVTDIALCAFYKNSALTTLSLPAGLQTFLSQSIYRCSNLQNILLDSSNTNFVCDSNVAVIKGDTLLFYCPGSLQSSYTVPDEVTLIDAYAFYGAANLQTISLPLSLEEVRWSAFNGCKALETVIYPGTEAYWNYSVSVDAKGNSTLTDAEYTFGTIDTIPGTTTDGLAWTMELTLGKLTISGTGDMGKRGNWPRDYIQTVVLEEGITSIAPNAFADSTLLKEITIPASVVSIGSNAFENCSALETVYYGGSEPQWGLVSVKDGNIRLQMAAHVYDSYLLVEWNSDHTVLSVSGEVEGTAYVMAAFYDIKGRMQLMKQYSAEAVYAGVRISSDTVDLTQCTAKVMVLDETFAPVGVPYTPDAKTYDYVPAWFYATEHAYIDGGAFASVGTLLFSDDSTVYTASTDTLSLDLWDLGQQYILTLDPSTAEVLYAEKSGLSETDECIQYDLDGDSKYIYVGGLEGLLRNGISYLTLDAECSGIPSQMDSDVLEEEHLGIATTNLYRAVDKDADGEVDYLLIRPYLYAMVETAASSAESGGYVTLTDPAGEKLLDPINNQSKWYISDIIDLEALPKEGSILKLTWNLEKNLYETEVLNLKTAEFTKISLNKGTCAFDSRTYYIAENGWVTKDQLTSDALGEYFAICTDGNLLVYAEEGTIIPLDASAMFTDGADIDEKAKNGVELLYTLKVMKGYADGSFNPDGIITRAEVAAILYRICTQDVKDEHNDLFVGISAFTDVSDSDWYAGYVGYCFTAGIIRGDSSGTFRPSDPITTAEAARWLLGAMRYNGVARGHYDADWEQNVLSDAVKIGLLENYIHSTSGATTRQWLAVMLENMLTRAYTSKSGGLLSTLVTDNTSGEYILMGEEYFALTEDSLIYRQVYNE